MPAAMTIKEFHAFLTSKPSREDSTLLTTLRKLMSIDEPEDILALAEKESPVWTNWSRV